ncbi:CopD family protein [Yunchengibacter salinarum]|uniref:CopD family protein n=1 Tax=Yunchengibacter salinarum TaxID=3133399 RepID=UPI0035B63E7B
MTGFLGGAYLWVQAIHVIFVIYWMAGLLMMPRFFAYHVEDPVGSPEDARWQSRELRLLRIIMNPAMIIAWILGLALAVHIGLAENGWLHLKLLLVLGLTGFHMVLARWRRRLAGGERPHAARLYRMVNEVPSLIIIAVVMLAILKPF